MKSGLVDGMQFRSTISRTRVGDGNYFPKPRVRASFIYGEKGGSGVLYKRSPSINEGLATHTTKILSLIDWNVSSLPTRGDYKREQ